MMIIDNVIAALQRNNMYAAHIKSRDELIDQLNHFIPEGSSVGYGGSVTIHELGIKSWLRKREDIVLFDRDISSNPEDEMKKSLTADVFLMSSNAVTENGELFNVDGRGNRCAALIYGAESVIVICGANKIVTDINQAQLRVKNVCAPLNAKRMRLKTPCGVSGVCADCICEERMCCSYVVTRYQRIKNRIKVFILDEELGY